MTATAATTVTLKPLEADLLVRYCVQLAAALYRPELLAEWKVEETTATRRGGWAASDALGLKSGLDGQRQDTRVRWDKVETVLAELRTRLGRDGVAAIDDAAWALSSTRSDLVLARTAEETAAAEAKRNEALGRLAALTIAALEPLVVAPRVRKVAPVAEVLELPLEVEERKAVAAAEPTRQAVTAAAKAPALTASTVTRRLRAAGIVVARSRALTNWSAKQADGTPGVVTAVLVRLEYASTDADVAKALEAAQAAGYGATMVDVDQLRVTLPVVEAEAVELETPDEDEAPTVAVAGDRYYAGRGVHIAADADAAHCGHRLATAIPTRAAASCRACGTAVLEAAGVPAAQAPELAAATIAAVTPATDDELEPADEFYEVAGQALRDGLAGMAAEVRARFAERRQAEAPAATLPGVDAAIVEAELGGRQDDEVTTLVVIPCSGAKLDEAAPAGELYTGTLHRAARAAADQLAARTPGARVVVLSALYGLLELDRVVEPYDVTIGDDGAIGVGALAGQLPWAGGRLRVVALTPGRYTELLRVACAAVDVELLTPLAGSRGIGDQRGRLARIRRGELDVV